MTAKTAGLSIVLVLAVASTSAFGDSNGTTPSASSKTSAATTSAETDLADSEAAWQRRETELFDALRSDSSPRIQVLAAGIYVDTSGVPAALRPSRDDVRARAVQLAPDDAVVQWIAASQSSYSSSACAPTRWPDAEVANLVALEPDNAAAWQFAVALATAKGDAAGTDEALSRMAASTRADDHLTDRVNAWTAAFDAHPDAAADATEFLDNAKPAQRSMIAAFTRVSFNPVSTKTAIDAACKPDGSSDRTWQRLGWCSDVGHLLAEKGSSLAVRKQGLDLLATIGDRSDDTAKAQRQYDWLSEHDANPFRHFSEDSLQADIEDWHGAPTEIAAIERHLKRASLPQVPPAGWTPSKHDDDGGLDADGARLEKLYGDYMRAVESDMLASTQPEQRVFAELHKDSLSMFMPVAAIGATAEDAARTASITALADANPNNRKLQWLVATAPMQAISDDARVNAIARVQDAESDNAAAWALSLSAGGASDELVDHLLQRMAASTRFDTHFGDAATVMLDAMRSHPLPADLTSAVADNSGVKLPADTYMKGMAYGIAFTTMPDIGALVNACRANANAALSPARHDACVSIGRLMVDKATTVITAAVGDSMLKQLDARDEAHNDRMRRIWWWWKVATDQTKTTSDASYMDDVFAGKSEIEAWQAYAVKLGKPEPPAGWQSPQGRL